MDAKNQIKNYQSEERKVALNLFQRWVTVGVDIEEIIDRLYDYGLTGMEIYEISQELPSWMLYGVTIWEEIIKYFQKWNRDVLKDRYNRRHY